MSEEYLTWEEKVLDQLERWVKYDKPITRKQAEETIDFICEQDNVIDRIGKQRDKQKEVLDKIKEKLKENRVYISGERHLAFEIEELLEEIE
jgi:transcription initiation factor IIE alpha subunit